MSISQCAKCGRVFTGVRGFDLHQTLGPDGITCHDPATMTRRDGRAVYVAAGARWSVNARDKGAPRQWAGNHVPATA